MKPSVAAMVFQLPEIRQTWVLRAIRSRLSPILTSCFGRADKVFGETIRILDHIGRFFPVITSTLVKERTRSNGQRLGCQKEAGSLDRHKSPRKYANP